MPHPVFRRLNTTNMDRYNNVTYESTPEGGAVALASCRAGEAMPEERGREMLEAMAERRDELFMI